MRTKFSWMDKTNVCVFSLCTSSMKQMFSRQLHLFEISDKTTSSVCIGPWCEIVLGEKFSPFASFSVRSFFGCFNEVLLCVKNNSKNNGNFHFADQIKQKLKVKVMKIVVEKSQGRKNYGCCEHRLNEMVDFEN